MHDNKIIMSDSIYLKLYQMQNIEFTNDLVYKVLEFGTVSNNYELKDLDFGRYVAHVQYDTLESNLQFLYKSGDFTVNVELQ